jgi:hypothetical protein
MAIQALSSIVKTLRHLKYISFFLLSKYFISISITIIITISISRSISRSKI